MDCPSLWLLLVSHRLRAGVVEPTQKCVCPALSLCSGAAPRCVGAVCGKYLETQMGNTTKQRKPISRDFRETLQCPSFPTAQSRESAGPLQGKPVGLVCHWAMFSLGPALETTLLLPIPCGWRIWGTAIKGTLVTGDELVLRQVV